MGGFVLASRCSRRRPGLRGYMISGDSLGGICAGAGADISGAKAEIKEASCSGGATIGGTFALAVLRPSPSKRVTSSWAAEAR